MNRKDSSDSSFSNDPRLAYENENKIDESINRNPSIRSSKRTFQIPGFSNVIKQINAQNNTDQLPKNENVGYDTAQTDLKRSTEMKTLEQNKEVIQESEIIYEVSDKAHSNPAFSDEGIKKISVESPGGIPKKVTLSWKSVIVSASTETITSKIKSKFKPSKTAKPRQKTILKNVDGIIEPGQMVALMGAR